MRDMLEIFLVHTSISHPSMHYNLKFKFCEVEDLIFLSICCIHRCIRRSFHWEIMNCCFKSSNCFFHKFYWFWNIPRISFKNFVSIGIKHSCYSFLRFCINLSLECLIIISVIFWHKTKCFIFKLLIETWPCFLSIFSINIFTIHLSHCTKLTIYNRNTITSVCCSFTCCTFSFEKIRWACVYFLYRYFPWSLTFLSFFIPYISCWSYTSMFVRIISNYSSWACKCCSHKKTKNKKKSQCFFHTKKKLRYKRDECISSSGSENVLIIIKWQNYQKIFKTHFVTPASQRSITFVSRVLRDFLAL